MKIDLHCHSKFSKRPVLWLMQKIGCPESFTEPLDLYHHALERGMSAVTITDHNSIEGCLEIANLPNTFISCEYTSYFPQDNCKIHVVTYDITEKQHEALNEARKNIFEIVEYMQAEKIRHVCAHPFFSPNERLTMDHVEMLLLLFKNWEWNGDVASEMNQAMRQLLEVLSPLDMERLAEKHGIIPHFPQPWKKNITAGSDDHSALNLARAYTQVRDAHDFDAFWQGVEAGQARIHYRSPLPQTLARSVYGIAYQFYKSKLNIERYVRKDLFLCFLERSLRTHKSENGPKLAWYYPLIPRLRKHQDVTEKNVSMLKLARNEAEKLIRQDPQLMAILKDGSLREGDLDLKWCEFVNQLSNKVLSQFGRRMMDRLAKEQFLDLFFSLGSAGALYALLAPYFVSYSLYVKQRNWSANILSHFMNRGPAKADPATANVAHFTDTFHGPTGMGALLRQNLAVAQEQGKSYSVLTCMEQKPPYQSGVQVFPSVGSFTPPEYPDLKLIVPPFLQILQHCYEEQYTHIHVSTPGPMGLAALVVARILQLPVSGMYHTAFPRYANLQMEDSFVEDMMWKYVVWFYEQLDAIYVPSQTAAQEITERGLKPDRIRFIPKLVNTALFHPEKARPEALKKYGLQVDRLTLLYVGRISTEKNVDLLARAFLKLRRAGKDVQMLMVGDGNHLENLQKQMKGEPVAFPGRLEDEELARVYASSDIFVFPCAVDTLGFPVLEAQASGLPVVVADNGGPRETVRHNETGLLFSTKEKDGLEKALLDLLAHPEKRKQQGLNGRNAMEQFDISNRFEEIWALYAQVERHKDTPDPLEEISPSSLLQAMAL